MSNYQKLDCWKESMQLVKEVYVLTKFYPKDELFGLTSQTRRAAVSIPSNIAEGLGRQYKKDSLQFFYISRGSLYELETQLHIGSLVEITKADQTVNIILLLEKCLRLLNGLINHYKSSTNDLK